MRKMKAVVLAGGGGTRLWPLSRMDFPKQFLNFGSGLSLLQRTVKRLIDAPFIDRVIVATNIHYKQLVEEQLLKVGANCQVFTEPTRRNTASAIALAVKILESEFQAQEEDSILVVPSDHLIEPEVVFLHALEELNQTASDLHQIITFGIHPTKAETGYGYIEIGAKFSSLLFNTKRFVEKPNAMMAEAYIQNPLFFWNSGMFLFSIRTFWNQLSLHSPQLHDIFQLDLNSVLKRFHELPDLSIDYAIMERSKDILLHPLAIFWSDVGSWDSVYEAMEKDEDHNVKVGQVHAINTRNSLIIGSKRIITTIGLDDLLIIETAEAILISKKGESQKVKSLLQELKAASLLS